MTADTWFLIGMTLSILVAMVRIERRLKEIEALMRSLYFDRAMLNLRGVKWSDLESEVTGYDWTSKTS